MERFGTVRINLAQLIEEKGISKTSSARELRCSGHSSTITVTTGFLAWILTSWPGSARCWTARLAICWSLYQPKNNINKQTNSVIQFNSVALSIVWGIQNHARRAGVFRRGELFYRSKQS